MKIIKLLLKMNERRRLEDEFMFCNFRLGNARRNLEHAKEPGFPEASRNMVKTGHKQIEAGYNAARARLESMGYTPEKIAELARKGNIKYARIEAMSLKQARIMRQYGPA
jgi:Fe2+ transport system protein FeoA